MDERSNTIHDSTKSAAFRLYMAPKTLSECVKIMSFMRNDAHTEPDLFGLFLDSGVYKQYAGEFLEPQQVDEVDSEAFKMAAE